MYQHDFKSVKEIVIQCASISQDLAYSDRSIIYRTPTATVTATVPLEYTDQWVKIQT